MSIQKIHYKEMPNLVQKHWVLYFLDFIYSGLIRGFLPSPMSNVFYFLRLESIVLIVFIFNDHCQKNRKHDINIINSGDRRTIYQTNQ